MSDSIQGIVNNEETIAARITGLPCPLNEAEQECHDGFSEISHLLGIGVSERAREDVGFGERWRV